MYAAIWQVKTVEVMDATGMSIVQANAGVTMTVASLLISTVVLVVVEILHFEIILAL